MLTMGNLNMVPLVLIVLGVCCFIDSTAAGCVDGLHGEPDYEKCKVGVAKFSQMQADNHVAMCSSQGSEAVGCWLVYATVCPTVLDLPGLLNGEPMSPALKLTLAQLPSAYAQICNPVDGQCSTVRACLTEGEEVTPESKKGQTPFTSFPVQLELMCNAFWPKVKCLNGLRDQCPNQVREVEETIFGKNATGVANRPGPNAPMHPEVQAFMSEECPEIPPQFSHNVCFNKKLKSKKFVNCYKSAAEEHGDTGPQGCPAFNSIRKCLEDNMLICGRSKLRAFVRGAHVLMFGGEKNCDVVGTTTAPVSDKDGSAIGCSGGISGSIATICSLLIMLLAHK